MRDGLTDRFNEALAVAKTSKAPTSAAEVPAARERISTELGFIGYVEAIHLAVKEGGHKEGTAVAPNCEH